MQLRWPIAIVLGALPLALIAALAVRAQHGGHSSTSLGLPATAQGPHQSKRLTPRAYRTLHALAGRIEQQRARGLTGIHVACGSLPAPGNDRGAQAVVRNCRAAMTQVAAFKRFSGCHSRTCAVDSLRDVSEAYTVEMTAGAALERTVAPGRCRSLLASGDHADRHYGASLQRASQAVATGSTLPEIAGALAGTRTAAQPLMRRALTFPRRLHKLAAVCAPRT